MNYAAMVRPTADSAVYYTEAARARWGWVKAEAQPDRWIDGSIALCSPEPSGHFGYEPLLDSTHPVLVHADLILSAWPEMRDEARCLLDEIQSGLQEGVPVNIKQAIGSICGPGAGWGKILVIASNPVGYAESVCHELGHHKLRALGIDMEDHTHAILTNAAEERYESGVRKDMLRPMSAVLHAHYSYLHVTECELRAASLGYDVSPMLVFQSKRLREGRASIEAGARWTDAGLPFRDGVLAWTDELLTRLAAEG